MAGHILAFVKPAEHAKNSYAVPDQSAERRDAKAEGGAMREGTGVLWVKMNFNGA